jgi:heme exporter protein A
VTVVPVDDDGLHISAVTRQFGRLYALRGVDLSIRPGETLGVFGNNGAGKSTLLQITASLLSPSSGNVTFRGKDIFKTTADYRRVVGFVSHQSFLYNDLTAWENLQFYGRLYQVPDLPARIDTMLDRVGLANRAHEPVRTFSRGMHQRVSVARAFLHDPTLILLDEPWSGLDQKSGNVLSGLLEELRGRDRMIMLTTHDLDRGLQMATKTVILERGKIVYSGDGSVDRDTFNTLYHEHAH